jgi:Flp pilus assembly CpaF family ATPase
VIKSLARAGNLVEIMERFPKELVHKMFQIEAMSSHSQISDLRGEPLRQINLRDKNFFIYGYTGSGKTR